MIAPKGSINLQNFTELNRDGSGRTRMKRRKSLLPCPSALFLIQWRIKYKVSTLRRGLRWLVLGSGLEAE